MYLGDFAWDVMWKSVWSALDDLLECISWSSSTPKLMIFFSSPTALAMRIEGVGSGSALLALPKALT